MKLSNRKKVYLCLGVVSAISILKMISDSVYFYFTEEFPNKCVQDTHAYMIRFLSKPLETRQTLDKVLLGVDSFGIDLVTSLATFNWVYDGKSLVIVPAIFLFYFIRFLGMGMANWPLPEPYLFFDTNFFSLLVCYDKTNDLYFSGHSGITFLIAQDSIRKNKKVLKYLASGLCLYTVFLLRLIGGHYANDIIIALFAAHCTYIILNRYQYSFTYNVLRAYTSVVYAFDHKRNDRLAKFEEEMITSDSNGM